MVWFGGTSTPRNKQLDMKRLAVVDGLSLAAFSTLVVALACAFSGAFEQKAQAAPGAWWYTCAGPIRCPTTLGTCGGCLPGAQIGACDSTTTWFSWCASAANNCQGFDPTIGAKCNCATGC